MESQIKFDVRKKLIDDKIANIKRKTKLINVNNFIQYLMDNMDNFPDEYRNMIMETINEGFEETGKLLLDRAFTDGTLTEEEYLSMKEKYSFDTTDFSSILQCYYQAKDNLLEKDDEIVLVTVKTSNVYKYRDFITKRFNVTIKCTEECISYIEEKEKGCDNNGC